MSTRGELSAAAWEHCERKCPHACRQSKRSGDCEHLLARRRGLERDIDRLELLLDLRALIAEATLVRVLVADMLVSEGWIDPEQAKRLARCRVCEGTGDDGYFTGTIVDAVCVMQRVIHRCEACDGTGRQR